MKMCRDPEDAKDVLQDTLLAMARGVRDFRGASSHLDVALHDRAQLLHQEAPAQQVRARGGAFARHRRGGRGQASRRAGPTSPDEALAGRQVERALEQAIAALEPMYREVLLLRDVEGLTAPEVAEVLGASVQAVKSRLHRARLSVRERVAPLLGVERDRRPRRALAPTSSRCSRATSRTRSAPSFARRWSATSKAARAVAERCDSLKRTLALCRTVGPAVPVPASVQASVKTAVRSFLAENA